MSGASREAARACCVCSQRAWVPGNEFLQCEGKSCQVFVHQRCYGQTDMPTHKWFCKKCEPHSLQRASKVKCQFCPSREGALKPTNDATSREVTWSHIVCALWLDGLGFEDEVRTRIDVSGFKGSLGQASCFVCTSAGKQSLSNVGASIPCAFEGCLKKFHVTCGLRNGLLKTRRKGTETVFRAFCRQHQEEMKANGGHARSMPGTHAKAPTESKSRRGSAAAGGRREEDEGGRPHAEAKAADPVPCPVCGREFLSETSLKKHAWVHNRERSSDGHSKSKKRAPAASASSESKAAQDGRGKRARTDSATSSRSSTPVNGGGRAAAASRSAAGASPSSPGSGSRKGAGSDVLRPPKKRAMAAMAAETKDTPAKGPASGSRDAVATTAQRLARQVYPSLELASPFIDVHGRQLTAFFTDAIGHHDDDDAATILLRAEQLQRRTADMIVETERLHKEVEHDRARREELEAGLPPAVHAARASNPDIDLGHLAQDALLMVLNGLQHPNALPLHPLELVGAQEAVLAAIRQHGDVHPQHRKQVILDALESCRR